MLQTSSHGSDRSATSPLYYCGAATERSVSLPQARSYPEELSWFSMPHRPVIQSEPSQM